MTDTILHDRWRILSALGHGGMGEVFLVENIKLQRKEALKILMPLLATDPLFVRRFRREARAVNRLRHPNIVALYDFGQLSDGRFFLSMEYAEGESLYKKRTQLPIPRALHLLDQLVRAVHHAHSRGVMHRDLKPDNLIVAGRDELLKVLDFGLAKIVAPDHQESLALSTDTDLWGTPAYMAPERANGVGDDPRSDLYAIGCIAYELVVGAPPFRGTAAEVLFAHATRKPDPPSVYRRDDVSRELEAMILRCLEKDPLKRYQSAAELFAVLRQVPGYPVPKPSSRRRFARASDEALDQQPTTPYANVRGTLRTLAEALLDRGATDPRLVGGVAILRDHEQIVARLEAVQDALEHETDALRETILDREASLRFALGELALVAAGPGTPSSVSDLVGELEERLAAVAEEAKRLQEFEQKIESIAQTRSERLTKLQGAYDSLGQVVNELLPAHLDDETIHTLAANLALARNRRGDGFNF